MKLSWTFCLLFLTFFEAAFTQRTYKSGSVLSSGDWYKIGVKDPGIYKIDVPFLKSLGININNLSSSSIRLFGNGGSMLPENCSSPVIDDLQENAIWVNDGGDGIFDGNDYLLFYASGPDRWIKDSLNKTFHHELNLYSDQSFYFLSIGGMGKRVQSLNSTATPNIIVTSFDEHYFYESDTFNFLGSGKQWYGDEFANAPGKQTRHIYNPGLTDFIFPQTLLLNAIVASRSVAASSSFSFRINGNQILNIDVPATTAVPTDPFAKTASGSASGNLTQTDLSLSIDFSPGSFNAQGWLDWFEILGKRSLKFNGKTQLSFRDWNSVGSGNIAEFRIQSGSDVSVWEVTDPFSTFNIPATNSGNEIRFVNDCSRLREYIIFNIASCLLPKPVGKINNQNLHSNQIADFIIVTHESLAGEANRLASHHINRDKLKVLIVTAGEVFNEFASGTPDPSAIRNYAKMFYDRSGGDSTKRPKYLLLLGDGSFDYKKRLTQNTNLIPAYESYSSLDPLNTYTSDDFFGYLDDSDDISNAARAFLLDIGVGRIPARDVQQAKAYVDKIINYNSPSSFGPWRNNFTFVADDGDFNLHFHDAENIEAIIKQQIPLFELRKIYLDAYHQESGPGGSRYPAANQAINNNFYSGTLIWDYTGHGGFRRLSEKDVFDQDVINSMNNPNKLPLFVTATCDFAPYDDPRNNSIGENVLLREKTGAIALMTTTRLVFAYSNRIMNQNYFHVALQRKADGNYPTLGEAMKWSKNFTYQSYGDIANNRKFTLLGDPALRLAFPVFNVSTTTVNGKSVSGVPDTLRALDHCSLVGEIKDPFGNSVPFNGSLYISVFDKEKDISTLGNDPASYPEKFKVQQNLLYKGKANVVNGKFNVQFIVPKDINYQFGKGTIFYYAEDQKEDGNGIYTNFTVGGSGDSSADHEGPVIKAFLNDEKFVNGSITNETPVLILHLTDSSGINITGNAIGHDLVAILDNNPSKTFVLNQFYESEPDNFRKGTARYQLPKISEGSHFLKIKAWDVANNSSEYLLEFNIRKSEKLELEHVLNYPNPFTTHTAFWFEHNHPGEELKASVRIFTITGKLVKTIRKTIFAEGNRSIELEWDGRDDYGAKIGRGVYLYILMVRTTDGKSAEKIGKLYLL